MRQISNERENVAKYSDLTLWWFYPNEHLNATTIVLSLPLLKGTGGESMMKKEGLKD